MLIWTVSSLFIKYAELELFQKFDRLSQFSTAVECLLKVKAQVYSPTNKIGLNIMSTIIYNDIISAYLYKTTPTFKSQVLSAY